MGRRQPRRRPDRAAHMPEKRGPKRKRPYGPCWNPCCPNHLAVNIMCKCDGKEGVLKGEVHGIFHPSCCATGTQPAVLAERNALLRYAGHDGQVMQSWQKRWPGGLFPAIGVLTQGRAHGQTRVHKGRGKAEDQELEWHRVPDEQRRARLLGQAMPDTATVCETCYQLINKGGCRRPEGGDDPATLRARALGMILGVPPEVRAAAAAGALHARMAWFF
eukprot:SAG22_NODE_8254_length_670_cov_1.406305_1_plen_217_part_01